MSEIAWYLLTFIVGMIFGVAFFIASAITFLGELAEVSDKYD